MTHPDDPSVQISQEMMWAGVAKLRETGMLQPGMDQDYGKMLVTVSQLYSAMRRLEPRRIKSKELFIIGGKGA